MKRFLWIGLISVLAPAVGCSSDNDPNNVIEPNQRVDITLTGKTKAAADNLTGFYADFTADAVEYVDNDESITDKNVIVSPLSAYMALAMLANGVDNVATEDIMAYLGVTDKDALNDLSLSLLTELPKADNQSVMALANSAWVTNSHGFTSDFSSLLTKNYKASLFTEDFSLKSTVDKINKWSSDNTNGMIPKIMNEITPGKLFFLINAMYYKGIWANSPFSSEDTHKGDFHGMMSSTKVDMMQSRERNRGFYRDDNFEAFSLGFGNGAFILKIALPAENLNAGDATRLLTKEQWDRFSTEGVECKLTIIMPKFKVERNLHMNSILESGGLKGLDYMDFSLLNPSDNGSAMIEQFTAFEVDEKGAKAAAVTVVGGETAAPISPSESYTVRVDRPFYFQLYERSTGAVLLSGRIADLRE